MGYNLTSCTRLKEVDAYWFQAGGPGRASPRHRATSRPPTPLGPPTTAASATPAPGVCACACTCARVSVWVRVCAWASCTYALSLSFMHRVGGGARVQDALTPVHLALLHAMHSDLWRAGQGGRGESVCAFIREQVSAGERMRGLERGKESARVRKGGIAGAVGQQMAGGDPRP